MILLWASRVKNSIPGTLDTLKEQIITAVIDGAGSIPGLETLTGLDADADDVNPDPAIDETIEDIVEKHVSDGIQEFAGQTATPTDPGYKSIDEIFKESIEDTIDELESYNSDIFSGT